MNYPVNEVFETIQGEGVFTGVPAIFVRLQGCPVGCAWCDTKQTWDLLEDKKVSPEQVITVDGSVGRWANHTVQSLIEAFNAKGYTARHVVITGGEPCMYDLNPLCQLLHNAGYSTQIETSGTFDIQAPAQTWVTVSPKVNMAGGYKVLQSALDRANEIKHPVAMEKHVEELLQLLQQTDTTAKLIYLQPISQQRRATELAIAQCKKHNWRLSVQVHKYLGIS